MVRDGLRPEDAPRLPEYAENQANARNFEYEYA